MSYLLGSLGLLLAAWLGESFSTIDGNRAPALEAQILSH